MTVVLRGVSDSDRRSIARRCWFHPLSGSAVESAGEFAYIVDAPGCRSDVQFAVSSRRCEGRSAALWRCQRTMTLPVGSCIARSWLLSCDERVESQKIVQSPDLQRSSAKRVSVPSAPRTGAPETVGCMTAPICPYAEPDSSTTNAALATSSLTSAFNRVSPGSSAQTTRRSARTATSRPCSS